MASQEWHPTQRVQREQAPSCAGTALLQPPGWPPEDDLRPERLSSRPLPVAAPARR